MNWFTIAKRWIRYNYLRVMRIKASAHSIALGMAVGMFVGFLPIVPFQTVTSLALAFLLRANKITAAVGTWVSNPLDYVPFYLMLYYVGKWVLPVDGAPLDLNNMEIWKMLAEGWGLFLIMCMGGLILGIPASLATYFLTLRGVLLYRKRKAMRLLKKNEEVRGAQP